MNRIEEIDGIGERLRQRLLRAGVQTLDQLVKKAGKAADRAAFAAETGIAEADLLALVGRADLQRVKGVGQNYARLLIAAGVATSRALARTEAAALHVMLSGAKVLVPEVKRAPTMAQVAHWILDAKSLTQIVT